LGLVSGLIVFILCLTGTIYALKPQIEDRLKAVEHQFDELLENDVKKFNKQLEKSRHKIDLEKKS